jgi:hypothetical protein
MGNIFGRVLIGEGVRMQSTTLILGLIIAAGIAFFFLIELLLMERRWKRLFEEARRRLDKFIFGLEQIESQEST